MLRIKVLCLLLLFSYSALRAEASGGGGHQKHSKSSKASSHGASSRKKPHSPSKPVAQPPKARSDVEALLSMITSKERKHDPRLYAEVDLGEFRVTHPGSKGVTFLVRFRVFGVLHERDLEKFALVLEGRQQRLRDAVLSVVHKTHYDHLSDPALDTVKSELVAAINRVLECDLMRDVAFSTFSMEPS